MYARLQYNMAYYQGATYEIRMFYLNSSQMFIIYTP